MIRLDLDNKVDFLGRCVAEDEILCTLLREHLLELQQRYDDPYIAFQDPGIRWTVEQLYDRIPSLFGTKLIKTSQFWEHVEIAIALFWGEESQILKAPPPPPVEAVEDDTGFKLDPPTSGNVLADLLASLIAVDTTVEGARILLKNYSIDTLQALTRQLNELRTPEKERLDKAKAKYLQDKIAHAKAHDFELYQKLQGLEEPKPL